MSELILVRPACAEKRKERRLADVLSYALWGMEYREIRELEDFRELRGKRLLFAIEQGESGINLEYFRFLKELRLHTDMLEGAVAGIIVDGNSELFTKSLARDFVFTANRAGCAFPGRPLTEGTTTLQNFNIQARNLETDNFGAYLAATRSLVRQVMEFSPPKKKRPKLLALHASNTATSNTSTLWGMVKKDLMASFDVSEISLRNGAIQDCAGCPYTTCLHFGEKERCFYGGLIVDQVYPAIRDCDGLMMICPNYNDALGANLSAFINRLTALFRKMQFYDKYLFGIVVSGYSGGDLVAGQLISSLNMNKTFILPSHFCMLETANDPGSILKVRGIEERAAAFAAHIMETMREQ